MATGYVAIAVIGMGALRLYTELAPKGVFGEANLLLTSLTLGTQLFVAPFTNTQLRYHTEAQARGNQDEFMREALRWALRGGAALGILAIIACLLSGAFGGPVLGPILAIAALVLVLATSVRNVLMSRLQAERRRIAYTGLMIAEALVLAGLTGAALRFKPTTVSFVAGQALTPVVLVILITLMTPWPILRPGRRSAPHTGFREKALTYGLPFAPLALVGWPVESGGSLRSWHRARNCGGRPVYCPRCRSPAAE